MIAWVQLSVQDVAKANLAVVNAKMQECINSGQMNSFDRLSNLFSGKGNTNNTAEVDAGDDDVHMNSATTSDGKDPAKVPAKKAKSLKHSKLTGQYGDKTTRHVGTNKYRTRRAATARGGEGRGRSAGKRSLEGRRARSSSKKGRRGSSSAMKM